MTTQKKKPVILTFAPEESLMENYLGRGIGIGGGALSGKAVFTLSEIERLKENEPATSLILITSDTVPEDIKKISLADGLLTAKGGQTSHAAIVALRLGKTCVVGCKLLEVYSTRSFAVINGKHIYTGDYISIDGNTGSVYFGKHIVKKEELRH
jgi:pyruvate,orthophosphate dikinase